MRVTLLEVMNHPLCSRESKKYVEKSADSMSIVNIKAVTTRKARLQCIPVAKSEDAT